MNKTSATVVADSINPQGDRLTSLLITFPRILLSEINTHRMLSKNTSSSRAIPFHKMVEAVHNNPFIPIAWQKEHTGMQGYEYLVNEEDIEYAIGTWLHQKDRAIEDAKILNSGANVTKQLCNRLLEPFMWTTMLITGSKEGWDNFFNLRCPQYEINIHQIKTGEGVFFEKTKVFKSKKDIEKEGIDMIKKYSDFEWLSKFNKGQAEIHMMALAEKIYDAVNESTPKQLQAGEWHIPFEYKMDLLETYKLIDPYSNPIPTRVKISTAMAAHTSYTIVGGEAVKSYEKWIELHDKLIAQDPPHSSPLEHCARAMSEVEYTASKSTGYTRKGEDQYGWCNNLKGFIPYRYMIDNNLI